MRIMHSGLTFLALSIVPFLGCAPEQIPQGSTPDLSLKNGVTWFWKQELDSGCVYWMAQESWVSTRVLVDTPCLERTDGGFSEARGLTYSSSFDEITFRGYWEWSPEIFSEQIVFDEEGNWVETKPCPHELTQAQIAEMQAVVAQAFAETETDHEQAVLARISERLESTNGKGLGSSQFGCSHKPNDPNWREVTLRPNPWTDE